MIHVGSIVIRVDDLPRHAEWQDAKRMVVHHHEVEHKIAAVEVS